MTSRAAVCCFALSLLAACGRTPEPASPQASAPVPESRTLCLAGIVGDGRIESSLRTLQRAATATPRQPERWVAVGREWVRQARASADPGFYLNVDGCAEEALRLEPGHTAALELRGLRLMNDHRFEQARTLALEIVARDPDSLLGYGTLSDALLELGRYGESAQAAQQQMRIRPGMAASARGSYLRWLQGDARGAKLLIRDALIGRDPSDPEPAAWVLAEAATLYWNEGDWDGADALYAESLKWLPTAVPALLGRARVAIARNDGAAALGYLRAAERVRPSVEAAWLRGDALEAAGDREGAERACADALRLGRRGDRLNLALFLATKNRNADEALASIEEEARTRAGVYVDDVRAWALYRAGRIDEALAASQRASSAGTHDARLLYHAGAIRVAAGDASGGRRLVAEAIRLNPNFDATGAREARALLAAGAIELARR